MTFIAWLVYIPLQLVWLPVSLLGAALVAYRQIMVSKRLGVSQTAVEILNGRWTMDVFGLREDTPARKLAAAIPNNSTFGLWLALFPIWLARQIAGKPFLYPTVPAPEKAGIANLIPSRTVEFDGLIGANVTQAGQFAVLGAGLDTRAYGPLHRSGLALFELDQPVMQAHKRKYAAAAGLGMAAVRYVATSFAETGWIDALTAPGFDANARTVFLWEGVTLYLDEQQVRDTLAVLKANAAPGSTVIADIYAHRFLKIGKGNTTGGVLEMTGEGFGFGLDFTKGAEAVLRNFVEAQGLTLARHQFLGAGHAKGPFMVIAELVL